MYPELTEEELQHAVEKVIEWEKANA